MLQLEGWGVCDVDECKKFIIILSLFVYEHPQVSKSPTAVGG